MQKIRLNIQLDPDTLVRLDEVRGNVPRAAYIRALIEGDVFSDAQDAERHAQMQSTYAKTLDRHKAVMEPPVPLTGSERTRAFQNARRTS